MIKKRFSHSLVRPALIAFLIVTVVARILNYDYLMLYQNTLVPTWVLLAISSVGDVLTTVRIAIWAVLIAEGIHHFGTYKRSFGVKATLWAVLTVVVEWVSKFLVYMRMGAFIAQEAAAIALYTMSLVFELAFVLVALVAYKVVKSGVVSKGGKNVPAEPYARIPRKAVLWTAITYGGIAIFTKLMDVVDFVLTTDNITVAEITSMAVTSVVTVVIYGVIGLVISHLLVSFFEKRIKKSAEG